MNPSERDVAFVFAFVPVNEPLSPLLFTAAILKKRLNVTRSSLGLA